jgi:omega-6 fatty acid desaturase (delta-12 desaturase)
MGRKNDDEKVTVVEQGVYPVPDIPIKDLLDAIPFVVPSSLVLEFLS